jgi:hypothetical protein
MRMDRVAANDQNLFRMVVINVLLYFNLAAILKTSVSYTPQPIKKAMCNRRGLVRLTVRCCAAEAIFCCQTVNSHHLEA